MQMRSARQAGDEYLKTRVMTATREELRLLLLEGAIRFANQGLTGLESGDLEQAIDGISQCRDIVAELLGSIREEPDPELAENVKSVYAFMFRELAEVGFQRDADRLREVIRLLEFERETWVMLMEQIARERQQHTLPASQPAPTAGGGTLSLEA